MRKPELFSCQIRHQCHPLCCSLEGLVSVPWRSMHFRFQIVYHITSRCCFLFRDTYKVLKGGRHRCPSMMMKEHREMGVKTWCMRRKNTLPSK